MYATQYYYLKSNILWLHDYVNVELCEILRPTNYSQAAEILRPLNSPRPQKFCDPKTPPSPNSLVFLSRNFTWSQSFSKSDRLFFQILWCLIESSKVWCQQVGRSQSINPSSVNFSSTETLVNVLQLSFQWCNLNVALWNFFSESLFVVILSYHNLAYILLQCCKWLSTFGNRSDHFCWGSDLLGWRI